MAVWSSYVMPIGGLSLEKKKEDTILEADTAASGGQVCWTPLNKDGQDLSRTWGHFGCCKGRSMAVLCLQPSEDTGAKGVFSSVVLNLCVTMLLGVEWSSHRACLRLSAHYIFTLWIITVVAKLQLGSSYKSNFMGGESPQYEKLY